jgi:hypothetical protein
MCSLASSPIITIEAVRRDPDGRYTVTFCDPRSGYWLGLYLSDGRLELTVWRPARHVPRLSPEFLASMSERA